MAGFDWLSGNPSNPSASSGGATGMLENPNFLQLLAGMGSNFSQGQSAGQAIGQPTYDVIKQGQTQQATAQLLRQLLGGATQQPAQTQQQGVPTNNVQPYQQPDEMKSLMDVLRGTDPTPKGQPGPDGRTINQTPEGYTVTTKIPSARNLSTYGPNVPAEAQPKEQNLPFP